MENTINKLIETKNLHERADLIKLALSKDVNKNLVEAEIASKDEASLKKDFKHQKRNLMQSKIFIFIHQMKIKL